MTMPTWENKVKTVQMAFYRSEPYNVEWTWENVPINRLWEKQIPYIKAGRDRFQKMSITRSHPFLGRPSSSKTGLDRIPLLISIKEAGIMNDRAWTIHKIKKKPSTQCTWHKLETTLWRTITRYSRCEKPCFLSPFATIIRGKSRKKSVQTYPPLVFFM